MTWNKLFIKRKISGFSLLEASISLIIVGIVSGVCISQIKTMILFRETQKTQVNIERIINSIGAYYSLATDGNIPEPSDFTGNIGRKSSYMAGKYGIVPFKSLGIMEQFAKDGKGRWIKYKMNPFFNKNTTNPEYINLGVKDFESDHKDKVAFIIKTEDENGKETQVFWISERNFKLMFKNEKVNQENENSITFKRKKQNMAVEVANDF